MSQEWVPRSIAELDDAGVASEWVRRVRTARVVYLDVDLLCRDFPDLLPELRRRQGTDTGDAAELLERWLVDEAGIISEAQLDQTEVNTPILASTERLLAYRPTRYGRSLVREVDVGGGKTGLLDLKGAGVAPGLRPSLGPRGNGLCDVGEVLRDLAMQEMIELIFQRCDIDVRGVPVYAVLDHGFDRKHGDGVETPAGLQVRQGHQRPPGSIELSPAGSDEARLKFQLEMLLRHFAITSCHPGTCFDVLDEGERLRITWGGLPLTGSPPEAEAFLRRMTRASATSQRFAGVNIQLTRHVSFHPLRATLVDFGQYHVREDFTDPVVNLASGHPYNWGGCIWPEDPVYVRPAPRLRLPMEQWGRPVEADQDSSAVIQVEGTYRWSFDVAQRFREGRLSAQEVAREMEAFLCAATAHWP